MWRAFEGRSCWPQTCRVSVCPPEGRVSFTACTEAWMHRVHVRTCPEHPSGSRNSPFCFFFYSDLNTTHNRHKDWWNLGRESEICGCLDDPRLVCVGSCCSQLIISLRQENNTWWRVNPGFTLDVRDVKTHLLSVVWCLNIRVSCSWAQRNRAGFRFMTFSSESERLFNSLFSLRSRRIRIIKNNKGTVNPPVYQKH